MSKYRQVQVGFWQDGFVLDLTPEEKYFYIYLMTNSKASQIGIYELPKRIIETETGYNRETVEKLLKRFIEYKKIQYNDSTKEIMIMNWVRHNWNNSPKVVARVEHELNSVKHIPFALSYLEIANSIKEDNVSIQYPYSIHSLCKQEIRDKENDKDKEKDKEKDKDNDQQPENVAEAPVIPFEEIIHYLNHKANTSYRNNTKKTQSLILARLKDGFTTEDFKSVIDVKCEEWLHDKQMNKFLRPETLFGTKFESYLNQKPKGGSQNGGTSQNSGQISNDRSGLDW